MSREGIRKLLGGYATGTLTAEEQQALFEAALDDQELFDALAREQSLRDLLGDPAARAQLLAALDDAPAPWHQRLGRWMWGHAVGLAAVACFLAVGGYIARVAQFTPARVRVIATEPTTVEVNGSAGNPAKPSRVFDLKSAREAAQHGAVELPPPPAIMQRPPATRLALNLQAPAIPPPPMPPGGLATAAGGGRGGSNPAAIGAAGGAPAPNPTAEATVTAAATPAPTTSSENSKLADSSQMVDMSLKGRDLFAVLTTVPGVYFGNAYLTGGDASTEGKAPAQQIAGGGTAKQNFQVDGVTDLDTGSNAMMHFQPNMDSVAEAAALRISGGRAAPGAAGRLDPALAALAQRVRNGFKPTAEESRFVSGGQAYVRLTLTNASAEALGQLKNAGLTITGQERNEIAGHIPVEKLEAIAQFPFVVWIRPR